MRILTFLLLLCLVGCQDVTQQPAINHVIVLGVDGLSPSGVQRAETPNFNRVLREGAFTFKARAVLGTSSSQNWASMIMGAGPEQHGITSNGWERSNFSIKPTVTGTENIFPTIFGVLREQHPEARIASIYDWGGFGRLYEKSAVDVDLDGDGPEDTMAKALEVIEEGLPDFMFIHLDHVDHAGHAEGHGSDAYYESVVVADNLLGNLLNGLEVRGLLDRTLLIITSDHGGIGTRHGGESMDELEIPWMAMGPGIKAGKQITDPVDTYDTAATAAYALGLDRPYAWVGRPVWSAFEGESDRVPVANRPNFVSMPRLQPASGTITSEGIEVKLSADHPEAEIRYTLDGTNPNRTSTRYEGPLTLKSATQIRAISFTADGGTSGVSVSNYLSVDNGVRYRYYEGEFDAIPDFSSLEPDGEAVILGFDLSAVDKREDFYSIHFESEIDIPVSGRYTFELTSDDGSKMWVDGTALIDLDGPGGARTETGEVDLTAGRHKIEVGYMETYGDNVLSVRYAGPGATLHPIPALALYKPD